MHAFRRLVGTYFLVLKLQNLSRVAYRILIQSMCLFSLFKNTSDFLKTVTVIYVTYIFFALQFIFLRRIQLKNVMKRYIQAKGCMPYCHNMWLFVRRLFLGDIHYFVSSVSKELYLL